MDQSLFAAPHGLSQRTTSFFACACQGIHQMPLIHFFVLIANVHLFLIQQTCPPRLRSKGCRTWPYGLGFPRLWLHDQPSANDRGMQMLRLPFTIATDKAIDMSIRSHMKITPSDLRAGS